MARQDRSARDTADLTRAEAEQRSSHLRVHGYDVELDLRAAPDPATTTFGSRTTIRFGAAAGSDTFVDLIAPVVESVRLNGVDLDPAQVYDGNRITVTGLAAENELTVRARAEYSRTGEGLHRFVDPVDGRTYLYTQQEPADARRVLATFEQPDLKAPVTTTVLAPAGWTVRANTRGSAEDAPGGGTRWAFEPSVPISTYLICVVAGEYHVVEDEWSGASPDGGEITVPMALLCRTSLAEHLDVEELFALTKAGLEAFHGYFGVAYPFGRYDQAFVPEYNLGAMENPGLVTLTEAYVFHAAVTDAERERRATTVLHEMAHMWFGDLVTMQWWDDLWLKESFADFMGTLACAETTRFTEAWTSFAVGRKAWAARQDQLPTTHPVVADIPDLSAAKQNFDGITYAKGASVLKQLVAYVGREEFLAGTQAYLREHEYGTTTLRDFLDALERTSGRDLEEWSRSWLETAGPSTLTPVLHTDDTGVVTEAWVEQNVARPHRVVVGCYRRAEGDRPDGDGPTGELERTERLEVDLTGLRTDLPALIGGPRPDLLLVNDDDLTYARTRFDPASLHTAVTAVETVPSTLSRAVVWSTLWSAVRDALLDAEAFVTTVLRAAPAEQHVGLVSTLHQQAGTALADYLPASRRDAVAAAVHERSRGVVDTLADGSDRALAWLRSAIGSAAAGDVGWLRSLLTETVAPGGVQVDTELRWSVWTRLAALGAVESGELDAELARADTAQARRHRARAQAGQPTEAAKAWAWEQLHGDHGHANAMLAGIAAGFTHPAHRELTAPYDTPYLDGLEQLWASRRIDSADRLVVGLFPAHQDAVDGVEAEAHPGVVAVDAWLTGHPGVAPALRRRVVEQRDDLVRSLSCQRAAVCDTGSR